MRKKVTSLIATGAVMVLMAATTFAAAQSKLGTQKRSGPVIYPDCYCTDRNGIRHELGALICISVGDRTYRAKCVMAQNNPFWRDQNEGCIISQVPQRQSLFPSQLAFATQ